jgi:sulfide:quinone oxidoreductase
MPIKCAGAPQKALYLSGDHWHRPACSTTSTSNSAMRAACSSASRTMCPRLRNTSNRYKAKLSFMHNLVKIDGPAKKAWFAKTDARQQGDR